MRAAVETELVSERMGAADLAVRVALPDGFAALPPHEQERELERAMTEAWTALRASLRIEAPRFRPTLVRP